MMYQWTGIWFGTKPGEFHHIAEMVIAETEEEAKKKFYEIVNGTPPFPLLSITRLG